MSMALQSRFGSRCRAALAVAVAMVLPLTTAAVAQVQPAAHAATAAESGVVQRAVTFTVVKRNRSLIACKSDGATYQVRGHITGAMTGLAHPQTATLLLHGLSYGEFFSNYTAAFRRKPHSASPPTSARPAANARVGQPDPTGISTSAQIRRRSSSKRISIPRTPTRRLWKQPPHCAIGIHAATSCPTRPQLRPISRMSTRSRRRHWCWPVGGTPFIQFRRRCRRVCSPGPRTSRQSRCPKPGMR